MHIYLSIFLSIYICIYTYKVYVEIDEMNNRCRFSSSQRTSIATRMMWQEVEWKEGEEEVEVEEEWEVIVVEHPTTSWWNAIQWWNSNNFSRDWARKVKNRIEVIGVGMMLQAKQCMGSWIDMVCASIWYGIVWYCVHTQTYSYT